MKALTMDYVTVCLIHEMSKRKENEPQCDDTTMILRQTKRQQLISVPRYKIVFLL